jgi:hypothetical protein
MKSVLSLVDLDWECFVYLKTFCFPPLVKAVGGHQGQAADAADPCELDLDGSATTAKDDETTTAKESFEFFGLGPLYLHPLLASYFLPGLYLENCVSMEQVLQILMDYMTLSSQTHNNNCGRKADSFRTEDFIAYLCGELNISHVSEVGIFIQGDLRAERLALQHAVDNRYRLFVEVTKRELAQFNQSMYAHSGGCGGSTSRAAKKRRKARSEEVEDTGETGAEDGAAATEAGAEDGAAATEADATAAGDMALEPSLPDGDSDAIVYPVAAAPPSGLTTSESTSAAVVEIAATTVEVESSTAARDGQQVKTVAVTSKFESKMKVYPSTAPGSAASTVSVASAAGEIYSVENAELQGLLPFVANAALGAGQGGAGMGAGASMDSREAGRWGEALVYQYLLAHSARGSSVQWLNQVEESRAAYDFIVTGPGVGAEERAVISASSMHYANASEVNRGLATPAGSGVSVSRVRTEYIEVKTTRFADRNVFEISPNEWQFAAADRRVPYHIYRVFGAGDPGKVRLLVVRDVYNRVVEGTVKLCMAV